MIRICCAFLVLAGALSGCPSSHEPETPPVTDRENQPLVSSFRDEDEEMNAAIRDARATLAQFERRLAHPPATQTYITLKAKFEDGGAIEHMWIDDVVVTEDGFRGVLGNDPVEITTLHSGDHVRVRRDEVSDWLAIDGGKLVGGYTVRVQRRNLPPDKRAEFDASAGFTIED